MKHISMNRNPLAIAVSAAALSVIGALPVAAQEASEEERVMEEVVVTAGYRKSLIDSIGTKRDSALVIEAISAEDIGKLPDQSIADSIARLPGIAAQRLDGRASSISIRGLGEDFSATTVNGREQVSIGDNRGVEFDLYPSEIVSGVVVYKTPNAALPTQGIGGIIDLRTARPLDYDERRVRVSAFYEYNDIGALNPDGEDSGQRYTASYIDQFADDTLGIAIVANSTTSPNNEQRWNSWGYPGTSDGDLILGGAKPFVRSSELDRDSVTGVVQWEPTDNLTITADAMYIDFSDEKILRGVEVPGFWGGATSVQEVTNGLVTQGVFEGRSGVVRNDYEVREAELDAFGLNVEYDFGDNWSLTADIAHSEVERQVWSLESYSTASGRGGAGVLANIGFNQSDVQGVQFSPDLDYADFDLVQMAAAQPWGNPAVVGFSDGQDGFINIPTADDELDTYRLDLTKSFDDGLITNVQFGAYYSERTKSKEDTGLYLQLPQYPNTLPVPEQYRVGVADLGFIGIPGMIAYDSFAFWRDGNYTEIDAADDDIQRSVNDWSVTEEIFIGYVMADLEFDMMGMNSLLNVGFQYVDTDQSSRGKAASFQTGEMVVLPTFGGDTYSEILPSITLNVNINDDSILRMAASRTMSRSRMDRMNAGGSFGFDQVANDAGEAPFTYSGGNPELRPNMADQFDISYEYYFREDGYIALAAYYKDLKSWQLQQDVAFDIGDYVDTSLLPDGVNNTGGIATLWTEAEGGDVTGVEVTAAVPFGYFANALEGFGVIASASFIDSSVEDPNGGEISVPGLSDNIFNFTAYYEKAGFEARVSMRSRDDFLGERFGISFTREYVNVVGATLWDAQVAYSFAESGIEALDGLTLTFQALNITEEPYETRTGDDAALTIDYQEFGATYMLGASYEF